MAAVMQPPHRASALLPPGGDSDGEENYASLMKRTRRKRAAMYEQRAQVYAAPAKEVFPTNEVFNMKVGVATINTTTAYAAQTKEPIAPALDFALPFENEFNLKGYEATEATQSVAFSGFEDLDSVDSGVSTSVPALSPSSTTKARPAEASEGLQQTPELAFWSASELAIESCSRVADEVPGSDPLELDIEFDMNVETDLQDEWTLPSDKSIPYSERTSTTSKIMRTWDEFQKMRQTSIYGTESISFTEACHMMSLEGSVTEAEASSAFRSFSRTMHPDKGGNKDQYQDLIAAYSVVKKTIEERTLRGRKT